MIKLVASDLDGTIIDKNNSIFDNNFKAFEDLQKHNMNFVVCTGKTYSITKKTCAEVNARFGIFGNGNLIMDLKNEKVLYKKILAMNDVIACIDVAKKYNMHIHAYSDAEVITEELKYSFELVKLHEGSIIPAEDAENAINKESAKNRIFPYFNIVSDEKINLKKYSYRKLNGSPIKKNWQFYFNEYYEMKDGIILSIKPNTSEKVLPEQPLYFMFIDINGTEKPNRIGQDIFFINIYSDYITALGEGKGQERLKVNCSPIGSGLYCSEYYLLGGSF